MSGSPARGLIAAALAFTVALFVFGSALVRALSYEAIVPAPPQMPQLDDTDPDAGAVLSGDALQLAIENDPFQPTRERPAQRYRLPGDVDPEPPPPPPAPPPLPPFVLRGTTVGIHDAGSSALIQLGDAPPSLIPVGSVFGGFQLREVQRGAAVMSDGTRDIFLRLAGPPQRIVAEPPPQRGNAGRNAPARNATPAQRQQQNREQVTQIMQALQRARQSGAPPELLQMLERALREAAGGADVRVSPGGGVMLRAVPDTTDTRPRSAPDANY